MHTALLFAPVKNLLFLYNKLQELTKRPVPAVPMVWLMAMGNDLGKKKKRDLWRLRKRNKFKAHKESRVQHHLQPMIPAVLVLFGQDGLRLQAMKYHTPAKDICSHKNISVITKIRLFF